ncbi:sulfotransferase family 2 domain-containing protein [Candidatus Woesearchaeota archaeon]|nr:sulfotransferase family 2 domain-containing protein [Candidatus Woesearchaeota archaeon]
MDLARLLWGATPALVKRELRRKFGSEGLENIGLVLRGQFGQLRHPNYFIHVPKCAGTSMLNYIHEHNLPLKIIGHNTRSEDYRFAYEVVGKHNAFCVVRNPFDRLVSSYVYLSKGGNNPDDTSDYDRLLKGYGSFERFVLEGLGHDSSRTELVEQIHLRPMTDWLMDEEGNLCVAQENIMRFERLDEEIDGFLKTFGMQGKISHKNRSRRNNAYRSMYADTQGIVVPDMVEIVADVYKLDIDTFDYSF